MRPTFDLDRPTWRPTTSWLSPSASLAAWISWPIRSAAARPMRLARLTKRSFAATPGLSKDAVPWRRIKDAVPWRLFLALRLVAHLMSNSDENRKARLLVRRKSAARLAAAVQSIPLRSTLLVRRARRAARPAGGEERRFVL